MFSNYAKKNYFDYLNEKNCYIPVFTTIFWNVPTTGQPIDILQRRTYTKLIAMQNKFAFIILVSVES